MSLPTIVGLYLLARVVERELHAYEDDLRTGVVRPVGAGKD